MLIFDQLKKNDPHLRWLAVAVTAGLLVLLVGLWWMQIVSARDYRANLESQSYRTVRFPAMRGKILDRNGTTLAENKPTYNVSLYLEDLRDEFRASFARMRPTQVVTSRPPFWKLWLGSTSIRTQFVRLNSTQRMDLEWRAQCSVVSNSLAQVSRRLEQPAAFDPARFKKHYDKNRPLPYRVARNLTPIQVARFQEQLTAPAGMDLELQTTRVYPHQTIAAHLLGYLHYDDSSVEGEEAFFYYRLPDYSGVLGVEAGFDKALHGRAGGKSVLVNNLGFRQQENIWAPAEAGSNVVLTIDLPIQQATEQALQNAPIYSPRGAAVVMDVNTGDILALASIPTFNPNHFVQDFPPGEFERIQNTGAEHNRATQENYHPGSIFKTVVALASLDAGLDPKAIYEVQPDPQNPRRGAIFLKGRKIKDTVEPGPYDLKRALIQSSNSYFITNGIYLAGIDRIVELGRRLHLGERIGLGTRQETAGRFPDARRVRAGWSVGDTANICIGQGYFDTTPLQMTVLAAALANGGKVLWPRLVDRIESQDPVATDPPIVFPKGRIRDQLGVKPSSMKVVRDCMLADVEEPGGTGNRAFIPGFRICGKTGTAQIENEKGELIDHTTWFLSFAPYENPRYAVVVMIQSGVSGAVTCAPVVQEIYRAILQRERSAAGGNAAVTQNR
jgi:penicillin-binding protein 2